MPIQNVERTAAPDDILAILERDGVVIIRELVDRTYHASDAGQD